MVSDQSPYDYDHWTDEKHENGNIEDGHFIHWTSLFGLVIGHWSLVIGPFVHLTVDYGQAYDNL